MMMASPILHEIQYAPDAFRLLKGCFCLYKPKFKGFNKTRSALTNKLSDDLNSMECRPPRERIEITGQLQLNDNDNNSVINQCDSSNLNVIVKPNLADHPLVSGPRYNPKYFSIKFANFPGWFSSGLMIGFIGSPDVFKCNILKNSNIPKIYEIKGEFGLASLNYRNDGKVRGKATYKHINKDNLSMILSKIESAQRSLLLKMCKYDINSNEAYQMALTGIPPLNTKNTMPFITSVQFVKFESPNFVFNVTCLNENEQYLAELCNEIGIELKSMARCTSIRLIKYGPFTTEHALLYKHWTLDNFIENLYYCNKIFDQHFKNKQKNKIN